MGDIRVTCKTADSLPHDQIKPPCKGGSRKELDLGNLPSEADLDEIKQK